MNINKINYNINIGQKNNLKISIRLHSQVIFIVFIINFVTESASEESVGGDSVFAPTNLPARLMAE